MKKYLILTTYLVLGLLVNASFADEHLFGPKEYFRTEGKPNIYYDGHSLPAAGRRVK